MLFIFPEIVSATVPSDIVINEIMYSLPETDADHEWIELYNTSNYDVDLTGWKFNDGSNHTLNIPPKNGGQGSIIMSAGSYLILTSDAVVFLSDHPGFQEPVIDTVMSLNNDSATLKLFDKNGNEITSSPYSKEHGADGNGKSLELTNYNQNNWKESLIDGGTPGAQNGINATTNEGNSSDADDTAQQPANDNNNQPPKAEAGNDMVALAGQEISFDASSSSDPQSKPLIFLWNFGDGSTSDSAKATHSYKYPGTYITSLTADNGESENTDTTTVTIYSNSIIISEFIPNPEGADKKSEWIELYNNSGQVADLSGWQIAIQNEKSKPFIFPKNTILSGRQFLVIDSKTLKISLNNTEGGVKLLYPNGQPCQEIKYEKVKDGQSIALTGNNQYFWTTIPTPGTTNIISQTAKTEKNSSPSFTATVKEASAQQTNIINNANLNPPGSEWMEAGFIPSNVAPALDATDNEQADQSTTLYNPETDSNKADSEENPASQEKTASLIDKISSPLTLLPIIIIFGLVSGLGMMKLKKTLKSRTRQTPIDWQD